MARKRAYCIDCPKFTPEEKYGSCEKYPWRISIELAKKDKVCSYRSFNKLIAGLKEPHIHDNFDVE